MKRIFTGTISRTEYIVSFAFYILYLLQIGQVYYNTTNLSLSGDVSGSVNDIRIDGEISGKNLTNDRWYRTGWIEADFDGEIDSMRLNLDQSGKIKTNKVQFFENLKILYLIGLFVFTFFIIVQGVKRCRDIGVHSLNQFIPFYFIKLMTADSNHNTQLQTKFNNQNNYNLLQIKSRKMRKFVFFWVLFHTVALSFFMMSRYLGFTFKFSNKENKVSYLFVPVQELIDYNNTGEKYEYIYGYEEKDVLYPFHLFDKNLFYEKYDEIKGHYVGLFGFYSYEEYFIYVIVPFLILLIVRFYKRFVNPKKEESHFDNTMI